MQTDLYCRSPRPPARPSSRQQRDSVNAKAVKDPRMVRVMAGKAMPFDAKRMIYGGFKAMVSL
jgi:uncharacterized protein YbaA (DUF1428 family)